MGSRIELSSAALARGFAVKTALSNGVKPGRLRSPDLVAPFPGTRLGAGARQDLEDRARLILNRLGPAAFISHRTAAELWGMQPPVTPTMVDVSVLGPGRAPHVRGVTGHSLVLSAGELVEHHGLRMTSPVRTWLDLAAIGFSVEDLIVAGDRIVTTRRPLARLDELTAALETAGPLRGIRALRPALPEIVTYSDSARETRLRCRIVRAGLPRPIAGFVLYDDAGRRIARPDLAFPSFRTLLEYEGDHHRTDPDQWAIDLDRFNRYQEAGWASMRIGAAQFARLDTTIAQITRILGGRGWRQGAQR